MALLDVRAGTASAPSATFIRLLIRLGPTFCFHLVSDQYHSCGMGARGSSGAPGRTAAAPPPNALAYLCI
jgi:hypothetical protein